MRGNDIDDPLTIPIGFFKDTRFQTAQTAILKGGALIEAVSFRMDPMDQNLPFPLFRKSPASVLMASFLSS